MTGWRRDVGVSRLNHQSFAAPGENLMKRLMQTALAVSAVPLFSIAGEAQSKGPKESAYEGSVGDWALGRWEGYIFTNYHATSLKPEPRILIIQRQPDGKVGCRWAIPENLPKVGWAPRCRITAIGLSLETTANSEVVLDRTGAELDGRMLSKNSTRYRANLKKVQ
jgi:hypothetical protein